MIPVTTVPLQLFTVATGLKVASLMRFVYNANGMPVVPGDANTYFPER